MPSHRVKNTQELRAKFESTFNNTHKVVQVGDNGLTRGELRKLERMGLVEKIYAKAKRKWLDVEPSLRCLYRRKAKTEIPII